MEHEFDVGDCVQLKSGGPEMIIEEIEKYGGEDKAKCIWFDGKKKVSDVFRFETLTKCSAVSLAEAIRQARVKRTGKD
jgi:uncharacterized protein YodC (DUF2158 family)